MEKTITIWPGYAFSAAALQKLYRERYLKISQGDMEKLTGVKQPIISMHENCVNGVYRPCVDRAFDSLGFSRWAGSVATCIEEAEMIGDMLDPTSREQYMTGEQMAAIGL